MSSIAKENVIFDSKPSSGWFFVAEGPEVDAAWLDLRVLERKCLKICSWETYKFLQVILSVSSDIVRVTV